MLKHLLCTLLALCGCAACSEKTEVFYTADYPVRSLTVAVEQQEEGTAPTAAQLAALESSVRFDAPVQEGGSYRTEFDRYDGGILRVLPAEGEEPVVGTFTKQPAAQRMTFEFGEERYTVYTASYTDGEPLPQGVTGYTEFRVDVTERYADHLPAACLVTKIYRIERTAHPIIALID